MTEGELMNYRFSNAMNHTGKPVKAECFHFSDATGAGEVVFSNPVHIFPGFCDVHVHFREPGFSY